MTFEEFISTCSPQKFWGDLAKTHNVPIEIIESLHRDSWNLISDPPNRKYLGLILNSKIKKYKEIHEV
jgi:hypothetical protein